MLPAWVLVVASLVLCLAAHVGASKGFFTDVPNDGHPLCNGAATTSWPYMMCWGHAGSDKKQYNCMWHTMELLSGWPGEPREPALKCKDIEIDCDASYICTVLLEYNKVGSMPTFGEDADRAKAAACLAQQCPEEAAIASKVVTGRGQCPHSHQRAMSGQAPTDPTKAQSLVDPSAVTPRPSATTAMSRVPTTEPPAGSTEQGKATVQASHLITFTLPPVHGSPRGNHSASSALGTLPTDVMRHANDVMQTGPQTHSVSAPELPQLSTMRPLETPLSRVTTPAPDHPQPRSLHALDCLVAMLLLGIVGYAVNDKVIKRLTRERPAMEYELGNRVLE